MWSQNKNKQANKSLHIGICILAKGIQIHIHKDVLLIHIKPELHKDDSVSLIITHVLFKSRGIVVKKKKEI